MGCGSVNNCFLGTFEMNCSHRVHISMGHIQMRAGTGIFMNILEVCLLLGCSRTFLLLVESEHNPYSTTMQDLCYEIKYRIRLCEEEKNLRTTVFELKERPPIFFQWLKKCINFIWKIRTQYFFVAWYLTLTSSPPCLFECIFGWCVRKFLRLYFLRA